MRDLVAQTRRGHQAKTARAYGTYLDFLTDNEFDSGLAIVLDGITASLVQ